MSTVHAALNVAVNTTITPLVSGTVAPSPVPNSLAGSAYASVSNIIPDYSNKNVTFSYLIYQVYIAADSMPYLAQIRGTVTQSIPGISSDFPALTITPINITGSLAGGIITLSFNASITYTKLTPTIYDVNVTP